MVYFTEKMKFPYKIIDLTHTLKPEIQGNTGIGGCGFNHEIHRDYSTFNGEYKFRVQKIQMHAGIGTHIDAPSHCFSDGKNVDQIDLEALINECFVIDIESKSCAEYLLSSSDILDFEKSYRKISKGSTVLVRTGWGEKYWNNPKLYLNEGVFPSVSAEAAELFLERGISALGIDVISPDRFSDGFPVHKLLLSEGKIIIENVANLSLMPFANSFVASLPIKAADCTEAPIRMVGLIPR